MEPLAEGYNNTVGLWVQFRINLFCRNVLTRCINVDEAEGICKDCSMWRFVVHAYLHGTGRELIY